MSARNKRRLIRSKKQNRIGDFTRIADAVQQVLRSLLGKKLIQRLPGSFHVIVGSARQDRPRADAVDAYVERREIQRHVSGHLQQCRFRGAVGDKRWLRNETGDRTEVDDRSSARTLHVCGSKTAHPRRAYHVDAQDPQPVGERRLESLENERRGVVDENVYAAEGERGFVADTLAMILVRDISVDEDRLSAFGSYLRNTLFARR